MDIGFLIKKIITSLIMPFPLALLLLCLGFLLILYRYRSGFVLQFIAITLLLASSFQPFSNYVAQKLEAPFSPFMLDQSYDAVVVLGSCHRQDEQAQIHAKFCDTGLYRLTEALRLWKANPSATLFVSGYAHNKDIAYATLARDFAIENGVPKGKIRVFDTPKDTRQEAEQMAPYLQNKAFTLVTSASHLRRSMLWFEHYGLTPIPAPAHFYTSNAKQQWRCDAKSLVKTAAVWHEVLGIIWAKVIISID